MSALKINSLQIGQSLTANNNLTWYQPTTPDGTVRLGVGNQGSTTLDVITVNNVGNTTFSGNMTLGSASGNTITFNASTLSLTSNTTISAASGKTLTLNGGAGSNGLVIDGSNNVGIGTGTPKAKLDISGVIKSTGTSTIGNDGVFLDFTAPNGRLASINSSGGPASNLLLATTNTSGVVTTAITIDYNQNVGLGVTPSGWDSNYRAIQGGNTFNGALAFRGGSTSPYAQTWLTSNAYRYADSTTDTTGWKTISGHTPAAFLVGGDSGTSFKWLQSAWTAGGSAITWTQAMTLDSSGNLGIGSTSPSQRLNVYGNNTNTNYTVSNVSGTMNVTDTTTPSAIGVGGRLVFGSTYYTNGNTMATAYIGSYKENAPSNGTDEYNHSLVFGVSGYASGFVERARITSTGCLLVGTTSPDAKLISKSGSTTFAAARFDTGVAGDVGQSPVYVVKYDNNTTTSQGFIKFYINNGGAASGVITASGPNAAAFTSTSDARLKENITALSNQLVNICALKPSEFDYKDGSGHQIGFIAQEMQEVYPDAVGEGEDGMLTITGWSKTEARLVKAIQELSAKVDSLQSELNELKGI